jgi:hypothetical protein
MTKKTRYFVITAGTVLVVGLGGGLVAYLAYNRVAGVPAGLPAEVRYVPADAEVVAFANVRAIMDSELRRALMPSVDPDSRRGKQMMSEFAGVDLEKQVDHVVIYVEPLVRQPGDGQEMPRATVLVNGSFDQASIEKVIREHAGAMEEYQGKKIFVHREDGQEFAVGLLGSDLIAMGQADLVRRAIDISRGSASGFRNITTNAEMMNLLRDNAGSTAWASGQFDEISRRINLPTSLSGQVPPVRLVSAKANINGGVKATIRAEAGDKAAGDQLRDVVRAFLTLARVGVSGQEELASVLKTVELSGTDTTVRLSFAVSPETLRIVVPRGRGRGRGPRPPEPPAPPALPSPPK